MKKIKGTFFMTALSLFLAVNTLGFDTAGGGIFGFVGNFFETIVSTFGGGDDNCPVRSCQGCRPTDGGCKPGGR